jgi:hypothetical protein
MRWWQVLLVLAVAGNASRYVAHSYMERHEEAAVSADGAARYAERALASVQSRLPLRVTDQITLDELVSDGNAMHFHGVADAWFEHTAADGGNVTRQLRAVYCGRLRRTLGSTAPAEFDIMVPPESLSDKRSHVKFTVDAQDCVGLS